MATARIHWVPEDDLLLKNSVEAGASLEALAKGAVRFSRRFTIQELRERWYALLYDPDISAQASDHMFELEISGINPSSKLNRPENSIKVNTLKRKSESIRRKYYDMRKKIHHDFISNTDLGLFEPGPHEFSGHGADFQKQVTLDGNPLGQNCMLGDSISDHLGLQEEDLDFLRQAFPETMREIGAASGTTDVPQTGCTNSFDDNHPNQVMEDYGFEENVPSSSRQDGNILSEANVKNTQTQENHQNSSVGFEVREQFDPPNSDGFPLFFASEQPQLPHWGAMQDELVCEVPGDMDQGDAAKLSDGLLQDVERKENSSMVGTGEFADPDSLLNLSNEDEILLVEVDEEHSEDKSYINNTNPALLNSRKHGEENDVAKLETVTMIALEASPMPASAENHVITGFAASSVQREQQMDLHPEVNIPVTSTSKSDFTELSDGKICCTLNTEDTEIPCNDDIFLLIHPSTAFGSSATQPNTMGSMDASAAALENDNEQGINLPAKAKESMRPFGWPQKVGVQGLQESHSLHSLAGRAIKSEMHDSRPEGIPGSSSKTIGDSSKSTSPYVIPRVSCGRAIEKDGSGVSTRDGDGPTTVTEFIRNSKGSYGRMVAPESVVESSASDQEESQIDDDVPYFSDVEAMILGMDLDPYDQDSQVIRQVPSYQYDDTKRTIIRLEQGARSCLQRAMTSEGALAIFYGRHLRHYIRKPEVLLGRSTEDVVVDIDLRKEGRANKISRRQAIIKMDDDGSFLLKNLGKSSLSVNGMTVDAGQLMALSSSCLIEIRGMSFVFEVNHRTVRKHLANFPRKNGGKTGKSESSLPEHKP